MEELDLPKATCVVRFDLLDSLVSYANSRARARSLDSHLILLAERGHDIQRRILSTISNLDNKMEKWVDSMKQLTASPPPRQVGDAIDPYRSDSDDDDDPEDFIQDPTTSGRIYPVDAINVVYRLLAKLDVTLDGPLIRPLFLFDEVEGEAATNAAMFRCTVMTPSGPSMPMKRFAGSPCITKSLARRSVCYELCHDLYQKGLLDYRLFPPPRRLLPHNQRPTYTVCDSAPESLTCETDRVDTKPRSGGHAYERKSPDFWPNTLCVSVTRVFPLVINIAATNDGSGIYHPLILLTRQPLPPLRSFDMHGVDTKLQVRLMPLDGFDIDSSHIDILGQYTVRLLRIVTNRQLSCSSSQMAYFFAPLKANRSGAALTLAHQVALSNGANCIDWDLVSSAVEHWIIPLRGQTIEDLQGAIEDCVLQDRSGEFARRYEAIRIRTDLNPLSQMGAGNVSKALAIRRR